MSYPIVDITWMDASSHSGWMPLEVVDKEATLFECHSVGYLLKRSKERVIVAQNLSTKSVGKVSDVMVIPAGWITAIKVLRKGRK